MKPPPALLNLALAVFFSSLGACSTGDNPAATTGDDPTLDACQSAPLCDPIVLPAVCVSDGSSFTCSPSDAGPGDDAGSAAGAGGSASAVTGVPAERLQCALSALRDRKIGGLTALVSDHGSKTCGTRFEIVSFGDGSASFLPVSYCDLDATRGTASRRALQPVAFFEDCLTSPMDDLKRLECLAGAAQPKPAPGGACTCRGINSDSFRGICSSN